MNVGDSRAYLRSATGEIRQLSRDHTELERLREEGLLEDGKEYASMYSSLSDCLVADPEAEDFQIHRTVAELNFGELLVLCSDGVHEVLGDSKWREVIGEAEAAMELVLRAKDEIFQLGAPDNFSIIVAELAPAGQ